MALARRSRLLLAAILTVPVVVGAWTPAGAFSRVPNPDVGAVACPPPACALPDAKAFHERGRTVYSPYLPNPGGDQVAGGLNETYDNSGGSPPATDSDGQPVNAATACPPPVNGGDNNSASVHVYPAFQPSPDTPGLWKGVFPDPFNHDGSDNATYEQDGLPPNFVYWAANHKAHNTLVYVPWSGERGDPSQSTGPNPGDPPQKTTDCYGYLAAASLGDPDSVDCPHIKDSLRLAILANGGTPDECGNTPIEFGNWDNPPPTTPLCPQLPSPGSPSSCLPPPTPSFLKGIDGVDGVADIRLKYPVAGHAHLYPDRDPDNNQLPVFVHAPVCGFIGTVDDLGQPGPAESIPDGGAPITYTAYYPSPSDSGRGKIVVPITYEVTVVPGHYLYDMVGDGSTPWDGGDGKSAKPATPPSFNYSTDQWNAYTCPGGRLPFTFSKVLEPHTVTVHRDFKITLHALWSDQVRPVRDVPMKVDQCESYSRPGTGPAEPIQTATWDDASHTTCTVTVYWYVHGVKVEQIQGAPKVNYGN